MARLIFSGHESFACKQFWLKKGIDFLNAGRSFNEPSAVIDLGVGKNMVRSIKFWLAAFEVIDANGVVTLLGDYLFGKEGRDPYLEDIGSTWLLHYHLVKAKRSSIYSLFFNEFRKTRNEFNKEQLQSFLKTKCLENSSGNYTPNTVERDITVFLKNYVSPKRQKSGVEDAFSGVLQELSLFEQTRKENLVKKEILDWYSIESSQRKELPYQIILYSILDGFQSSTISFKELQFSENSPGRVFAINAEGIYSKIQEIISNFPNVIYTETAGNRVLQFKTELDKWKILNEYYK